jgi:hypothetical protein
METIEIDFDVYKALTGRRATASVTYNDVLRELLNLGPAHPSSPSEESPSGAAWVSKGVSFPHGTEFRAQYKGQSYTGKVDDGALVLDGKRYTSPSAAAMSITASPVNGWMFWDARQPGRHRWVQIKELRR